jgi:hypothetical protein
MCKVFIVCVVLCTVFCLIVVLFCVLCLIVVPLPLGENTFAVKINNNNKNNKNPGFQIPSDDTRVSRSVLYEIVTVQLRYRKICAKWVPRTLTDEHKWKKQLWTGLIAWRSTSVTRGSSGLCNVWTKCLNLNGDYVEK